MSKPSYTEPPQESRREWWCAYALQKWKNTLGPTIRKAYAAESDEERRKLLTEAEVHLRALVLGLESLDLRVDQ